MRRSATVAVRLAAAAAALLAALPAAAADPVAPAVGGVHLFQALERSPAPIVAIVHGPRALDGEAFTAELEVELVLAGAATARGARLRVAWEELARSRPPRFADGDRVLVALEPLAGASIWRQRIPEPEERVATLAISEQGDAFVRAPSSGEAQLVLHFLKLPPELREGNPGVAHLIRLAETASDLLALAAVERLSEVPDVDAALDPVSASRLVAVLLREPPAVRDLALDLIEKQRPASLRPPILERARPDATGPWPVYEALARLDGSLEPALTQALLASASADHRVVGARHAAAAAAPRLASMLRRDPAPIVRAAAVERLVELGGVKELDRVLFALGDPDRDVRARAMVAIAELGSAAVPSLRKVAENGQYEAARTAVGALGAAGPDGLRVLAEIRDTHPDEEMRQLARIALGEPIGDVHGGAARAH